MFAGRFCTRKFEEMKELVKLLSVPAKVIVFSAAIGVVVGTWLKARLMGYDSARLAHLEQKYSYKHLEALVREVFDRSGIKILSFPLQRFRFDLSMFNIFEIAVPQTVQLGHEHGEGRGASRS